MLEAISSFIVSQITINDCNTQNDLVGYKYDDNTEKVSFLTPKHFLNC